MDVIGVSDYWVRKDTKHAPDGQLHAHIAHKKHINTKTQQVTWNLDGTKKDKKTFNDNFNGMTTAKDIARKALNLPADFQLESINDSKGKLLIESFDLVFVNKPLSEKEEKEFSNFLKTRKARQKHAAPASKAIHG